MRVLIDTSYAQRGPSGTGVYIRELAAALRAGGDVELIEAAQRRRLASGAGNPLRSAANALLDGLWLHVGLPRAARAAAADVVHHPLPAHSRRIAAAQVATVHDVGFERLPGAYSSAWRRYARRLYRRVARRSDALVCPSATVARDAELLLGADPARTVVVLHGPGQSLPPVPRVEPPAHLLYVGDAEPRKNLDALGPLPLPLVVAGPAGERVTPRRLAELYAGAAALVHPSLLEGFGLTIAEAMAAGVPVVGLRTPAAQELWGGAALLVEETGLAEAVRRVAQDETLREDLARRGRERAASLSWARCAAGHAQAYSLAGA